MALQDDVANLTRVPLFRDLDPEALRLMAFSAETRILRAGDVLFNRGDSSDCGYVVLSGGVALETGFKAATVVRPPTLIGENALLAETRRPATALAREPSSVLKISRVLFHRVLAEYPEGAIRLRRAVAARLQVLRSELAEHHRNLTSDDDTNLG